jgi:hypothetical protein
MHPPVTLRSSPRRGQGYGRPGPEAGFSLMEAIAATVIAVLAAMGLAYSFGIGRTNINRYEAARIAEATAQSRMEWLGDLWRTQAHSESLFVGVHPATANPLLYHGRAIGVEYWRVDPGPAGLPLNAGGGLLRITAVATWTMGALTDSIAYSRLIRQP